MLEYHCNRCGCDFSEKDGYEYAINAIVCPKCGATRWDDEDNNVITERNDNT